MLEIELKCKINGREVPCDAFIDAVKMQLIEAVKAAIPRRPVERSHWEFLQQSPPSGPRAFSVAEAAKLPRVSKATVSCSIREGKLHAIRAYP